MLNTISERFEIPYTSGKYRVTDDNGEQVESFIFTFERLPKEAEKLLIEYTVSGVLKTSTGVILSNCEFNINVVHEFIRVNHAEGSDSLDSLYFDGIACDYQEKLNLYK